MANKKKYQQTNQEKKVSYYRRPENMPLAEWQTKLRVQYGRSQDFTIKNIGEHKFFSDFDVFNPRFKSFHKVSFRDGITSLNYCSCADFKINRLGTCKHVEAVRFHLESKRGYKTAMKRGATTNYSSVFVDYRNGLQIKLRQEGGQQKKIDQIASEYFTKRKDLRKSAYSNFHRFVETMNYNKLRLKVYPDAMEMIINQRANKKRGDLIGRMFVENNRKGILNDLLKVELYSYQLDGVEFAIRAGRCIIADDMGLGKTIQSICAAEFYFNYMKIHKVLIICPTSLKAQWRDEIQKFTHSSVHIMEGTKHKRPEQYELNVQYLITSHGMARNDIDWINETEFDLIILDEAQKIKNWDTKISRAYKQLKSPYAFALSGTPVENKLQELYSVMQFVDIHKLGPLHNFIAKHTIRDETGKVEGYQKLNEIGQLISDCVIRRRKSEVLKDLPKRIDINRYVEMTEGQYGYYSEYESIVKRMALLWRRKGFLTEDERLKLLINLSCMRMVCDSSYIVDQSHRHDTKVDELIGLVDEILESSDEKIVIFSEWKRMHHLIKQELEERNVKYEYLNGDVPSSKRGKLIERFMTDPEIKIFLSTDAGGQGLNLQAASVIVNVDLPWNPAVLEQRVGRIYRIGQNKNIRVINLITLGSIEFEMLERLKFKSGMAAGILDGGDADVFMPNSKLEEVIQNIEAVVAMDNSAKEKTNGISRTDAGISEIEDAVGEKIDGNEIDHHSHDMEKLCIEDESLGNEQANSIDSQSQAEQIKQAEQLEAVMNKGLDFLSGMMHMMTGGKSEFTNQKINIDPGTGEVVMRFKITK